MADQIIRKREALRAHIIRKKEALPEAMAKMLCIAGPVSRCGAIRPTTQHFCRAARNMAAVPANHHQSSRYLDFLFLISIQFEIDFSTYHNAAT